MEERCPLCNAEKELVGAITNDEVMKMCRECAQRNDYPIAAPATEDQINKANRFQGVRERLYGKGGVVASSAPNSAFNPPSRPSSPEKTVLDPTREISHGEIYNRLVKYSKNSEEIEKQNKINVEKERHEVATKNIISESKNLGKYEELIDNFHWHIQHGRRLKKVSQKQLAEMIAEKEETIVSAEKGSLPEDYNKLVSKLEQFLNIKIKKKEDKPEIKNSLNEEDNSIIEENLEDRRDSGFLKYFKSLKNWWSDEDEPSEKSSEEPKIQDLSDEDDEDK